MSPSIANNHCIILDDLNVQKYHRASAHLDDDKRMPFINEVDVHHETVKHRKAVLHALLSYYRRKAVLLFLLSLTLSLSL